MKRIDFIEFHLSWEILRKKVLKSKSELEGKFRIGRATSGQVMTLKYFMAFRFQMQISKSGTLSTFLRAEDFQFNQFFSQDS